MSVEEKPVKIEVVPDQDEAPKGENPAGPAKPDEGRFDMYTDSDTNPTRLFIEIPLANVAMDDTINRMVFMLGFFENAKNEAIAIVRNLRSQRKKREADLVKKFPNIILPGNMTKH